MKKNALWLYLSLLVIGCQQEETVPKVPDHFHPMQGSWHVYLATHADTMKPKWDRLELTVSADCSYTASNVADSNIWPGSGSVKLPDSVFRNIRVNVERLPDSITMALKKQSRDSMIIEFVMPEDTAATDENHRTAHTSLPYWHFYFERKR